MNPLRHLHRSAYFCAPLLALFAASACSSAKLDDAESESLSSVSERVQLTGVTATASAVQGTNTAALAVDASTTTRWESPAADPQWIRLDLGSKKAFDRVYLNWEGAYGKQYRIEQSDDGTTWTTLTTVSAGDGGIDDLTGLAGNARYVRMYGTQRGTGYGYSLFDMQVHQTGTGSTCASNDLTTSTTLATLTSSGTGGGAVDNNATGTRWESSAVDPSWLRVDLGAKKKVNRVRLDWETANAKDYRIELSDDGNTWSTLVNKTGMAAGNHRIDDLTGLNGAGRYVRVYGSARTTGYGYSIWEMDVYGDADPNCGGGGGGGGTCTPSCSGKTCGDDGCGGVCGTCGLGQNCSAAQACVAGTASYYNTGKSFANDVDFGPNVKVYSPSTPAATIQSDLDATFAVQEANQFGSQRNAFLFAPGTYSPDVKVGFYTQVAGAGDLPDAVNFTNLLHVNANWMPDHNATCNFWRSIENFRNSFTGSNNIWAVSQAAPFRRIHLDGSLNLSDGGWSSGGFMADSKIDGWVISGSQQQWYTRNTALGNWNGSNWNMVFQGVSGAPANTFPYPPMTNIASTPVMREKPFVYVNRDGKWTVFSPAVRTNSSTPSWTSGTPAGTAIPLTQFYVAKAGTDTAATMNAALSSGKHLLITPGVYHLNAPIAVNNANTVVLGLGLATLVPDNGVKAMTVADVDGVKIAGLLFDAGTVNSPVMLEVGPSGATANHSANPTSLHDLVFRVGGGTTLGKADVSIAINSNQVIGDHFWVWRADHGDQVGWTVNTARNGVVVNGNDVTLYGLFVEHFQQYQVLWNGNNGKTFFYQSELPYDAPTQAAWMNGASKGWASYKVADTVTTHEAWGMGIYAVFTVNPGMALDRAIEVPGAAANVKFHNLVTLSITEKGAINNVINSTGGIANPLDFNTYPRLTAFH